MKKQEEIKKIPSLMIAGVSSSSGKTIVTIGIIGKFKKMGLKVQAYKSGPDYIDTAYLSYISERPSYNLDLWLMGANGVKKSFFKHSQDCDISLIEGAMGLFDGDYYSCAEIAKLLNIPVILSVNCEKTGESIAAIIEGFINYDKNIWIAGVVLTKLSNIGHFELIKNAISKKLQIEILGYFLKDKELVIKERHLGLKTIFEKKCKSSFLNKAVLQVEKNFNIFRILEISSQEKTKENKKNNRTLVDNRVNNINKYFSKITFLKKNSKIKIVYSSDEAFNFFYRENLEILEEIGAVVLPFSPLEDEKIPDDTRLLIIWGGFPEVFAERLSCNKGLKENIIKHYNNGLPIYAECGGFIYLSDYFVSCDNKRFYMLGLIPVNIKLGSKLAGFGYKIGRTRFKTIIGDAGICVKGHEFHYSFCESEIPQEKRPYELKKKNDKNNSSILFEGYASSNIFASYLHLHFAGNLSVALNLVKVAKNYNQRIF